MIKQKLYVTLDARVRHKSDSVIPDEFTDDEVSVDKFLLLHKSTPSWAGESQSKAQVLIYPHFW